MTALDAAARRADPGTVWQMIGGFTTYWTVAAAVELGVFAALAERPRSGPSLARACRADPRKLGVLLDTLVALGLCDRAQDVLGLTDTSRAFLVPGQDRYMGDLVIHSPGPYENWTALADTMRSGSPPQPIDESAGLFYARLVRATFPTQYAVAQRIATLICPTELEAPVVLDLGAGAAPWAVAILEAHPRAMAVVNDLPEVLPEAERSIGEHGVAERCSYLPGDYRTLHLGTEAFDVLALGHVCRAEGETGAARLIRRAADALEPGGSMVIADYFVDDERSTTLNALLLGMTMAANTTHATTFTYSQYVTWLGDAGLVDIRFLEPIPHAEVFVARKPID